MQYAIPNLTCCVCTLGTTLVRLCNVFQYVSFLSVCGNLALALLTATMAFRIYKSVLAAVNKGGEGHPFRVRKELKILIFKMYKFL